MAEHLSRFASELAATFLLCTIAILAMAGTTTGDAGRMAAATAYGLGVLATMACFGPGGAVHLNPAVTLAAFVGGRIGLVRLLACTAGQVLGGCCAGLLAMWLLAGAGTALGMPVGSLTRTSATRAVVVEAVLTFVWAGTFLAYAGGGRIAGAAPLGVGLAVAAAALAGGPFTGAALNPARALASAVAAVDFSTLWIFVSGPLAGAAVAGLLGRLYPSADAPARRP